MSDLNPDYDADSIRLGTPAWRVALLYPPQGSWSEADYLTLEAGRLVEFDNGCIEVLEMPTKAHQRVVQFLYRVLFDFVQQHGLGEVFVAPLPIRLWAEKFREPDVVFVASERGDYHGYPDGADIVIEVVSEDATSRRRDLQTKRSDYAKAGIAEFWIIDPSQAKILVGRLRNAQYDFAEYSADEHAHSNRLPGLTVSVAATLAAQEHGR